MKFGYILMFLYLMIISITVYYGIILHFNRKNRERKFMKDYLGGNKIKFNTGSTPTTLPHSYNACPVGAVERQPCVPSNTAYSKGVCRPACDNNLYCNPVDKNNQDIKNIGEYGDPCKFDPSQPNTSCVSGECLKCSTSMLDESVGASGYCSSPPPKVPLTPCPTSIGWGEKCSNDSYCNLYGCDGIQYCSDDNKLGELGYPCELNFPELCNSNECVKCPNLDVGGYCQGLPTPTYNYCDFVDEPCDPIVGGNGKCIPYNNTLTYCIPTDNNGIPKNNTGNIGDPCLIDQPASCKSNTCSHWVKHKDKSWGVCINSPAPTTPAPTTPAPSTPAPSTPAPTTPAPTTPAPSTPAPSTPAPSTPAPTSPAPTTPAPTPIPIPPPLPSYRECDLKDNNCQTNNAKYPNGKCFTDPYNNKNYCVPYDNGFPASQTGSFGDPCLTGELYEKSCISNLCIPYPQEGYSNYGYCSNPPTYKKCSPNSSINEQCTGENNQIGICIPFGDNPNNYCIPIDVTKPLNPKIIEKIAVENTGSVGDPCWIDRFCR